MSKIELQVNFNSKRLTTGVNAAVGVGGRVRFHIVKLCEREIGISNWQLNMEVIGNRRAHRAENIPDIFSAFPPSLEVRYASQCPAEVFTH